jgi:hypothetical protein
MVKKKKKVVRKNVAVSAIEKPVGAPWFRKRMGLLSRDMGWGWVPITWQGYVLVLLLMAVNVFSVFYFRLNEGSGDATIKFLTVLALSLLIFSLVAIKKTRR